MASLRATALAFLGLVGFLLLWEALPFFGWVNPAFLPGPSALPRAFLAEIRSGAWLSAEHGVYALRLGADRRGRVSLTLAEPEFRALIDRPGLRRRPQGGWVGDHASWALSPPWHVCPRYLWAGGLLAAPLEQPCPTQGGPLYPSYAKLGSSTHTKCVTSHNSNEL